MSSFLLLFFSFFLLAASAHFLIKAVEKIAEKLDLSLYFLSATLIALATSLPELATSLVASSSGHYSLALASLAGSNICNTLLLASALFLITPIRCFSYFFERKKSLSQFYQDCFLVLAISFLLWALILIQKLNAPTAIILFISYCLYLYRSKQQKKEPSSKKILLTQKERIEMTTDLCICFLCGAALFIGGHYLVQSSVALSQRYLLSERFFGATIVALGTSAPEIATTLSALFSLCKKEKSTAIKEVILGNLLGSNLINFLWILPLSTLTKTWSSYRLASVETTPIKQVPLKQMPVEQISANQVSIDFFIALCAAVVLFLSVQLLKRLHKSPSQANSVQLITRALGVLFLGAYLIYINFAATY